MRENIEESVKDIAIFIIETGSTVRNAAKHFGISKSTVHKDMKTRLKKASLSLYEQVDTVLQKNKAERHIRGGLATKHKYEEAERTGNK